MKLQLKILLLFAVNVLTIRMFAVVSSPQITCVKVLSNGDVTLTWLQPTDPSSEFTSYNIFASSTLNGTYSPITTINNYSTLSYTHTGANASALPKFYYITTTSNSTTTEPALDTVRTIYLVVTNPNNGVAYLQWNPVSNPLPIGSSQNYNVYKEYPLGVYTLLGTTDQLKWRDTINVCSYFFNYRIEISNSSGCNSISNLAGDVFTDVTPPSMPIMDSVSINSSNQTIIGLSPSPSPDAVCYVIYQKQGFSFIAIDTICGNVPTLYQVASSNPTSESETYAIASIDSCGNIGTITKPGQNTIFLNYAYTLCNRGVLLGWNAYTNMKNGLLHYKIYMSVNNGPYTIVGTTSETSFSLTNLTQNKNHRFFVRAFNTDNTASSTSNVITFFSNGQSLPSYVYIKSVSVMESQDIIIEIKADSTEYFRGITVYRALNDTGTYKYLGYIAANGASNYSISDNNVETAERTYYYKAVIIDSCGLEAFASNISRSILLQAKSNTNKTNTLTWIDYETYLGSVVSYKIYRSINDVFDISPIATVSGGTNNYTDNVIELVPYEGKFSYYVQAVEGNGNPLGVKALSNSNIVDTYHSDSIFVPSAFVPKGVNKVFLPITQYVEKTEYKLSIYDRWGIKIWETADDSEGWDGEKKDGGLYAYLIEYKNAYGEYKQITGTVMMIK